MVGVRLLALSALIVPAGLAAQASPTVGDTVPSIVADSAPRPASALSRLFGWSGKLRGAFPAGEAARRFVGDVYRRQRRRHTGRVHHAPAVLGQIRRPRG